MTKLLGDSISLSIYSILSLNFHNNSAEFWGTQLLNVLQPFLLIKILPLHWSERYSLKKKHPIKFSLHHSNSVNT